MRYSRFLFLARPGLFFIAAGFLVAGLSTFTMVRWGYSLLFLLILLSALIFTGFCLNFFRDPERGSDADEKALVSSADGRVVELLDDVRFDALGEYAGNYRKLSIFMSVFDVHVNRSPVKGKVANALHKDGLFLAADKEEASFRNECNYLCLKCEPGGETLIVKQIAGIIARRILCWAKPGDSVQRGERFGMIMFGSRVELFIPKSFDLCLDIGDKVKAGRTVIARQS